MSAFSRETAPPLTGVAANGDAVVGETAEELEEQLEARDDEKDVDETDDEDEDDSSAPSDRD